MPPLSPDQKQKAWSWIISVIKNDVEEQHKPGGQIKPRIKGFFKNKFNAMYHMDERIGPLEALKVTAAVLLSPLPVPAIRSMLNTAIEKIVNAAEASLLFNLVEKDEKRKERDPKLLAEWMVSEGAERIRDALRKLDEAEAELKQAAPIRNCEDFHLRVEKLCYWEYRVHRLEYYKNLLQSYVDALNSVLAQSTRQFDPLEKKTFSDADSGQIFDWTWHYRNCHTSDFCMFPWDKHRPTDAEVAALYPKADDRRNIAFNALQAAGHGLRQQVPQVNVKPVPPLKTPFPPPKFKK